MFHIPQGIANDANRPVLYGLSMSEPIPRRCGMLPVMKILIRSLKDRESEEEIGRIKPEPKLRDILSGC